MVSVFTLTIFIIMGITGAVNGHTNEGKEKKSNF